MQHNLAAAILALCLATACTSSEVPIEPTGRSADRNVLADGNFEEKDGHEIGTVKLVRMDDRLSLDISISGLEPGTRAIHLHSTGLCEGPEFKSAGGHLNPTGATHGSLSEGGKHLGDLPNIVVPATGQLAQSIVIEGAAASIESSIFDDDGTSVMIHAGPDDYISDPAGNAGPRIACAVLKSSD